MKGDDKSRWKNAKVEYQWTFWWRLLLNVNLQLLRVWRVVMHICGDKHKFWKEIFDLAFKCLFFVFLNFCQKCASVSTWLV